MPVHVIINCRRKNLEELVVRDICCGNDALMYKHLIFLNLMRMKGFPITSLEDPPPVFLSKLTTIMLP